MVENLIARTTVPTLSRGFYLARHIVKPAHAFVVHGGSDTGRMADGITAIGLIDLMRRLAEK